MNLHFHLVEKLQPVSMHLELINNCQYFFFSIPLSKGWLDLGDNYLRYHNPEAPYVLMLEQFVLMLYNDNLNALSSIFSSAHLMNRYKTFGKHRFHQ